MTQEVRFAPTKSLTLVLGALAGFGPLSIDLYLPGLPSMSHALSTSASLSQLTITACMLGLATGQLVAGPISDARGRRWPLISGIAVFVTASALCALAPTILVLLILRFIQGAAGASGIVIARAIVRDLHAGVAAARFFALLAMITGIAPIGAPLVGGQLLTVTDWRGIFAALAVIGALLLVASWHCVPETLQPRDRQTGGLRATLEGLKTLVDDRSFMRHSLTLALSFAGLAAYIGGSPFVMQRIYGMSPQSFSLVFALNGAGVIAAGAISRQLVGRVSSEALLHAGLWLGSLAGIGCVAATAFGLGLPLLLPALFLAVASEGIVMPNATMLALSEHGEAAGSASALLGLTQFGAGAAIAPLPGIAGATTAIPLGLAVATPWLIALTVTRGLGGAIDTGSASA